MLKNRRLSVLLEVLSRVLGRSIYTLKKNVPLYQLLVLEAITGVVLWEKVFLEISQNSQENNCASLFFNKVAGLRPATLLKKTLAKMFSCEFCEIFKNTFFQNTSGRLLLKRILGSIWFSKFEILSSIYVFIRLYLSNGSSFFLTGMTGITFDCFNLSRKQIVCSVWFTRFVKWCKCMSIVCLRIVIRMVPDVEDLFGFRYDLFFNVIQNTDLKWKLLLLK